MSRSQDKGAGTNRGSIQRNGLDLCQPTRRTWVNDLPSPANSYVSVTNA